MRIALVHASDLGHGAEQCVLQLHDSLCGQGHDSRLYVGTKRGESPHVDEIPRPRPFRGFYGLRNRLEKWTGLQYIYSPGFRGLENLFQVPDIIHIHTLWSRQGYADVGAIQSLSSRFPVILTMHDQWLTTGHCACPFECKRWQTGCGRCPDLSLTPCIERDATRWNWLRKKNILQNSDVHVTTVSNWLKRIANQSPVLSGKPITMVYNSIDTSVFRPGDRLAARKRFGIPVDRPVVLMAGQTIEGVNQGIAQQWVEAINRIPEEMRLFPLLVGYSAEQASRNLTLPFRTLPFQDDPLMLAECYRAADFTLITSEYETFGRIAAESQACGTPVITFDVGGLPEVVQHGVGGVVVPNGDVERLTAAIREFAKLPEKLRQMGREGAAWVEQHFSNGVVVQHYLNLYHAEIARRKESRI